MQKRPTILIAIAAGLLFAGGLVALLAAQDRVEPAVRQDGRPETESVAEEIQQSVRTPGGVLYALSRTRGFLVSFDEGRSWSERNQGLSRRQVHPFTADRVRRLTSLGVDPAREARVAVTMASEVFLSEDYGSSWVSVPLDKPLRSSAYFTSVALSPADPNALLLGTSFNGFYETKDRGSSWQDPSISADGYLNRGAGFYEEISGLSYDPREPGVIWFACGFGNGLYRGARKAWSRVEFPGDRHGEAIQGLAMQPAGGGPQASGGPQAYGQKASGWALEVRTTAGRWRLALPPVEASGVNTSGEIALGTANSGTFGVNTSGEIALGTANSGTFGWQLMEVKSEDRPAPDPFLRERQRKAADRFGIYLSSFRASGQDLDRFLAFLKEHGLNSVVVDCKDDYGWVTYDTALELPKRVGAVERRFRLDELLSKAHAQGIYVIGRVVVFKDRQLYNFDGFKYALWSASNQPWRHLTKVEPESEVSDLAATLGQAAAPEPKYFQREYWLDPYSPFVWSYNTAIAEELQARGVDEIQFDYIRFPSDGNLGTIRYRFQREGMDMIDALESFLAGARQTIHIPISTDLYGYSTWHRMGNWIGQSTEMLAEYVDVICPMYYPSHFPREFMPKEPYLERARRIYYEGTLRALAVLDGRSLVRPYVQAFLIGGELAMGVPEYSQYLLNQIQGCLSAPSSGFTMWNASNRYYMVTTSLKPLLPAPAPVLP